MGYYKILSTPISDVGLQNYKGLYRSEPFPQSKEHDRFMSLWQRSVQNADKKMGMTTELTIDELKELADLATKATGKYNEVIFFSEIFKCPHKAEYYGIDVAGLGGYSMVGENFFTDFKVNGIHNLYDIINQYFRAKLNANCLFDAVDDAISFRTVLNNFAALSPSCIEGEDWRIFHIFKAV